MGLEIVALGLIVVMRYFRETFAAQFLNHHLVERPLVWASKLDRHHLLYLLIAVAMLFAAGEVIAIVGSADVALGIAWDVSLYLDTLAVAAAIAVARQVRIIVRLARGRMDTKPLTLVRRRRRERRSRTQSPASAADNDEGHRPILPLAA